MTASLSPVAFETLASLLKTKSGLIIGMDKLYLLETRLAALVKREKLIDLNGLAERLRRPGSDAIGLTPAATHLYGCASRLPNIATGCDDRS